VLAAVGAVALAVFVPTPLRATMPDRIEHTHTTTAMVSPDVPVPKAPDVLVRPTAQTAGPLLLFLPATGHVPSDYTAFFDVAAKVGYHVLGLTYFNLGLSVARTCEGDASCYTAVQRNRLEGVDPSRFSAVKPDGSILHRYRLAIRAAANADPQGGWDRYLSHGEPVWSDIVMGGHSQGGGESAYIAHLHVVRGVLMFSSPVEDDNGVLPTWMDGQSATPPSRMYAFDDRGDVYHSRIAGSWAGLGIPRQVSDSVPHGQGVHLLETDRRLGTPDQAHVRSVTNDSPGVAEGHPVFGSRWRWMLQQVFAPPADTTVG
jgi:hypothetical protein